MSVQFRKNFYSRIALGVTQESIPSTKLIRGSLHKFNHIMSVEFTEEWYEHIGSFTGEQLSYTVGIIKGEGSYLEYK